MQTIGNYFHIPFCRKKCPYCHFYVHPNKEEAKDLLLEALKIEWERSLPFQKKITSIYFGGGTPTLFGIERLAALLKLMPLGEEITIEANPEDINFTFARQLRDLGFNRLSLGAQSLDFSLLQILGRDHQPKRIEDALNDASRAGFQNISIDLMYELPYQTFDSWKATVDQIANLPITHLSLYNLAFEKKTPFYRRYKELCPHIPSGEESVAMLTYAIQAWEKIGLKRYEISAFAKEGYFSRHNTGYWMARPFLGFGPSAFSYMEGRRWRNASPLSRYAKRVISGEAWMDFEEELPYPQNIRELLAIRLRMLDGAEFIHVDPETKQRLSKLCDNGLLQQEGNIVKLTERGMLFYDEVATEII